MSEQLINDLKKAIATHARSPLIVCGAGVSIAATNREAPSWAQLIESGIAKVISLDLEDEDWATFARSRLKKNRAEDWIKIADDVTRALGGTSNAEFAEWIAAKVGQLRTTSRELVDAIASLGCPIATTNYDDVLSAALDVPPITWDDPDQVARFLRGELSGVLHLHGHWRRPGTVVLGSASYEALLDDSKKEVLSNYVTLDRSTVYIGCSADGLSDPDFTHLGRFVSEWQQSAPRSYWLVKEDQRQDAKAFVSSANPRLFPIAFGAKHENLASFIRGLAPLTDVGAVVVPSFTSIDQQQSCPEIFGREAELTALEDALATERNVLIGGGPGMGKTALAVSALYRPKVRACFGDRRIFVSLEAEREPRALVAGLAVALGLPSSGEVASLLRQIQLATKETHLLALLDNAEGVFDANRREAERVLGLMGQIEGLTLVLTIRGVPPRLPAALTIDDLLKLTPEASRTAFAAIVGQQVEEDPDLDPLIETLDGHALSIDLVAARAKSGGSLAAIREAWRELRTDFLKRIGEAEGRLTSVGASLALSLESKVYKDKPFAKRLLGVLSLLPGGLPEDLVSKLIGERGALSKKRAIEAIEVLRTLRLLESRVDQRLRMLTPLREAIQFYVTPAPQDQARLIDFYRKLMGLGRKIGTPEWENTRGEVDPESGNLEPITRLMVDKYPISRTTYTALIGLSEYMRLSGQGAIGLLEEVLSKIYPTNDFVLIGSLHHQIASIAADRAEDELARKHFNAGLSYSKISGRNLTQGNCLQGLGRLEESLSRLDEAEKYFQLSLERYAACEDKLGQSNSIRELAELKDKRGQSADAIELYNRAIATYDGPEGALGRAYCESSIAELSGKDLTSSMRAAADLCTRLGVVQTEAVYLTRLALILQGQDRLDEAHQIIHRSLEIARKSDIRTEGFASIVRGIISKRIGESGWKVHVDEGFSLLRIKFAGKDRAWEGFRYLQDYVSGDDPTERHAARERTRSAWLSVPRHDLIRYWLDVQID